MLTPEKSLSNAVFRMALLATLFTTGCAVSEQKLLPEDNSRNERVSALYNEGKLYEACTEMIRGRVIGNGFIQNLYGECHESNLIRTEKTDPNVINAYYALAARCGEERGRINLRRRGVKLPRDDERLNCAGGVRLDESAVTRKWWHYVAAVALSPVIIPFAVIAPFTQVFF